MSLPPGISAHVRTFLTSSEVDLQTVSAKQIRKHLTKIYPDLDVKALRSEIDGISIPIFHEIKEESESAARAAQNPVPVQTNHSSSSFPGLALPSRGIPGVIKAVTPVKDEGSANATNGSSNSTTAKKPNVNGSNKPSSKGSTVTPSQSQKSNRPTPSSKSSKKRKSAAYVNSDDESDGNGTNGGGGKSGGKGGSNKKKRAPRKPRASNGEGGDGAGSNKGIHQELNCSGPLSELIGVATCSRPQVVKKLWEYIKSKDLQDPNDKRQILCDEALKKVFKTNTVHMFTMNKLLGDHLSKDEEVIIKTSS